MRKPDTIERLYLDFDGFFASVEQQARPHLRGRPVGVVPFAGTRHTCVIACSKEAKARGSKKTGGRIKSTAGLLVWVSSPSWSQFR